MLNPPPIVVEFDGNRRSFAWPSDSLNVMTCSLNRNKDWCCRPKKIRLAKSDMSLVEESWRNGQECEEQYRKPCKQPGQTKSLAESDENDSRSSGELSCFAEVVAWESLVKTMRGGIF